MAIQVIAGSRLLMGGKVPYKTKVTQSDFAGQVWREIGPLTNLGDLTTEYGLATQEVINEATTQYRKTVKSFPTMENTVLPDRSDPGQIAFQAAADSCHPYAFMVQRSTDCEQSEVVTISVADPAVVAWANHGFAAGTPVRFEADGGTMPTGLLADTTYYIAATPAPAAGTFSVAATVGGTAIEVTAAGTATSITATASPIGETDLFFGLPMGGGKTGGGASDVQTKSVSIQPICVAITV